MIYICDYKRHLICTPYSILGLHAMAKDLNINRCWYHSGIKSKRRNPISHYDIPVGRLAEIMSKCTIVTTRELIAIVRKENNLIYIRNETIYKN